MPYKKAPTSHGEFSGGPELIDPVRRKDRVVGTETGPLVQGVGEELMEIYATNVTDDPTIGSSDSETSDLTFRSTGR